MLFVFVVAATGNLGGGIEGILRGDGSRVTRGDSWGEGPFSTITVFCGASCCVGTEAGIVVSEIALGVVGGVIPLGVTVGAIVV